MKMDRKGIELNPEVKKLVLDLYQQDKNIKNTVGILNTPGTTISYVFKKSGPDCSKHH